MDHVRWENAEILTNCTEKEMLHISHSMNATLGYIHVILNFDP